MERSGYQRFRELLEELKNSGLITNDADFARKTDVKRSYISELRNEKRVLTATYIERIYNSFPCVSQRWLLTGEGEMLKDCQNYNNNGVLINGSNTNSPINNKHYYSDALQTQNEQLLERVKEKDEQIKEKDAQIKSLLAIIEKQTTKGI